MLLILGYTVIEAAEREKGLSAYINARNFVKPFDITLLDLTISGGKGGKETVKDILKINKDAKVIAIQSDSN